MTRLPPAPVPSLRPEPPRPMGGGVELLLAALAGLSPGFLPIEALIDRIEVRA